MRIFFLSQGTLLEELYSSGDKYVNIEYQFGILMFVNT